jgi:chromosome segregation ATPase
MNSYLKKYTDALLTLHGIPLTNYEHDVGVEELLAEMTARKTLETAMWNLCQHAEAQDEKVAELKKKVAIFDNPENLRSVPAVEKLLEEEREELIDDGWKKADEYQEQAEELEEQVEELEAKVAKLEKKVAKLKKQVSSYDEVIETQADEIAELKAAEHNLVDAVRELRDHITDGSMTAEESAAAYLKIVEFAKKTLAPYEEDEEDALCGCAECEECPSHINPHLWAETIHGAEEEEEDWEGKTPYVPTPRNPAEVAHFALCAERMMAREITCEEAIALHEAAFPSDK